MNSMKIYPSLFCLITCVALGTSWPLVAEEKPEPKPPQAGEVRTDFSDVPEGWLVGLDRAREVARSSGKDMLLDFSASDWVPPSIALEERVFAKKEFAQSASEDFVLVRLDFPRKRNIQSEALKKQNLQAAARYEVQSYPTVVLADSLGRPYAATGWRSGVNVESFLQLMTQLQEKRRQRDANLAAASKAEGAAKVPFLVKAIEGQAPGIILKFYQPQYRQILQLDPDNAGGLAKVVFYEKSLTMRAQLDELAEKGQWEQALKVLDEFREQHAGTPQQKQQIEFFKINGLLQLERWDDVMPFLNKVIAMDPESAVGKRAASLKPELAERIARAKKRDKSKARAKKSDEAKAVEVPEVPEVKKD